MERKKAQLHFRFHNPNPAGAIEKTFEQMLVQKGVEKLHSAICETNEITASQRETAKIAPKATNIA